MNHILSLRIYPYTYYIYISIMFGVCLFVLILLVGAIIVNSTVFVLGNLI